MVYPTIVEGYGRMCVHLGQYFILSGASIMLISALISDISSKHKQEMNAYYLNIGECRHKFTINRCEDPVPEVRSFCIQQE